MHPIFLIVGPPAVGKSSTSRAVAAQFPTSIHVPVDDIRHMVVSGLALPSATWSDALAQQIRLARASVATLALAYHAAGFAVVIDDFWDVNQRSDYQAIWQHPHLYKVVLLPAQAVAHQRNLHRSGDSPARAYIDEGIRIVYQQLQSARPQLAEEHWGLIDTSTLSIDESAAAVLQLR